jgi:hypothetical protein
VKLWVNEMDHEYYCSCRCLRVNENSDYSPMTCVTALEHRTDSSAKVNEEVVVPLKVAVAMVRAAGGVDENDADDDMIAVHVDAIVARGDVIMAVSAGGHVTEVKNAGDYTFQSE